MGSDSLETWLLNSIYSVRNPLYSEYFEVAMNLNSNASGNIHGVVSTSIFIKRDAPNQVAFKILHSNLYPRVREMPGGN